MNALLYLIGIICAVWVIYDVWAKQVMQTSAKILWTLGALFFSVITAIVYYFAVKKA